MTQSGMGGGDNASGLLGATRNVLQTVSPARRMQLVGKEWVLVVNTPHKGVWCHRQLAWLV